MTSRKLKRGEEDRSRVRGQKGLGSAPLFYDADGTYLFRHIVRIRLFRCPAYPKRNNILKAYAMLLRVCATLNYWLSR
jgi:hypothetical protein